MVLNCDSLREKGSGICILRLKKKRNTIETLSIDSLFDDFIDTDFKSDTRPAEDPWGEDYLTKLHKKKARKTLEKLRKNEPISQEESRTGSEQPVLSEKISMMRKCQNCY
jgi:hypothetical protein